MAKAKTLKQISFGMKNKVGQLSVISEALSKAKVNITAMCAWGMDKKAFFMMITNNNTKAKKIFSKFKVKVTTDDVVAVEMTNRAGQLEKVAKKISDAGIDIYFMYGTTGAGKSAICIFKTDNDKKVVKLVNKK